VEITPTGRDIALVSGATRVGIGTVAAVLRSLNVGGIDITEPLAPGHAPSFGSGIILAPWPNRVRDAVWHAAGEPRALAMTEPDRRNAIHGLLRFADYEVRELDDDTVLLGAIIPPQSGWPYFLDTWVRYTAVGDGIEVTHGAVNLSGERAPWAAGAHPFFRVGDTPVEELVVTVHADGWIETDDRLLPVAELDVEGTPADLRSGRVIDELDLDTAFTRVHHVTRADGRGEFARLEGPHGVVSMWDDADWTYAQVFTPRAFPGAEGVSRRAIAIEPMTAPPDALNTGEGLVWLEPGETWEGHWGVTFTGVG